MPWLCQTLQRFLKADSAPPPWQPASDHAEYHPVFTVPIPVSSLAVNPSSQDLFPPPQENCSCSGHPWWPPFIVAKINDQFSILMYFHHLQHFLRQSLLYLYFNALLICFLHPYDSSPSSSSPQPATFGVFHGWTLEPLGGSQPISAINTVSMLMMPKVKFLAQNHPLNFSHIYIQLWNQHLHSMSKRHLKVNITKTKLLVFYVLHQSQWQVHASGCPSSTLLFISHPHSFCQGNPFGSSFKTYLESNRFLVSLLPTPWFQSLSPLNLLTVMEGIIV